jgi:hypothetical protein
MAETTLVPVDFHGISLIAVRIDGAPHVALKPICEALTINWQAQHLRIQRHPVLSTCVVVTKMQIPGDDQSRELVCLPLNKLNGWLFGISAARVHGEARRERLIEYQRECFDVLAAHFGAAQPALPDAASISAAQAGEIATLIAERFTDGRERPYAWSRFNTHFRVARYRELPASQFHQACQYIHTMPHKQNAPALPLAASPAEAQAAELASLIAERLTPTTGLHPGQRTAIEERIDRLGRLFHPFSAQFGDVMGIQRALRGKHPDHGMTEPGWTRILPRIEDIARLPINRSRQTTRSQ